MLDFQLRSAHRYKKSVVMWVAFRIPGLKGLYAARRVGIAELILHLRCEAGPQRIARTSQARR